MPLSVIMRMSHGDLADVRERALRIIGKSFDDDNLRTFLYMAECSCRTIDDQLGAIARTRAALGGQASNNE